jgi:hypothetical protein
MNFPKYYWCRESIQIIIIYLHMKLHWNRTMLNLCGIVAAILKMGTGRNFPMSGINSGHHYGRLWCPELIPEIEKFLPVSIFSSPDPKGQVRYCHHLASVVRPSSVVRPLTFHILIYSSETTGPNGTKLGTLSKQFQSPLEQTWQTITTMSIHIIDKLFFRDPVFHKWSIFQ